MYKRQVRALVRRSGNYLSKVLSAGNLSLDCTQYLLYTCLLYTSLFRGRGDIPYLILVSLQNQICGMKITSRTARYQNGGHLSVFPEVPDAVDKGSNGLFVRMNDFLHQLIPEDVYKRQALRRAESKSAV